MAEAQQQPIYGLQWQQHWAQVVAKAWLDADFKGRLLADPAAALKSEGLLVPAGTEIKVVQDTDRTVHLTLPTKPDSAEISDEQLNAFIEGDQCVSSKCTVCSCPCGPKAM